MALNKEFLLRRLDEMVALSPDWDGFGTQPVSPKARDVAREMIMLIEVPISMQIFVGVEVEGSVYGIVHSGHGQNLLLNQIDITVRPDGIIDYVNMAEYKIVGEGSVMLSYHSINDLLR